MIAAPWPERAAQQRAELAAEGRHSRGRVETLE
jgi:hypothetical protein